MLTRKLLSAATTNLRPEWRASSFSAASAAVFSLMKRYKNQKYLFG
jgi:hypothetical protein